MCRRLYWEGAPWPRAGGQGNSGGLLCLMAHSLRCSGDSVSVWYGSGQSSRLAHCLTQGSSWWHEHLSAEVGSSEKVFEGLVISSLFCPSLILLVSFQVSFVLQCMFFSRLPHVRQLRQADLAKAGGFGQQFPSKNCCVNNYSS